MKSFELKGQGSHIHFILTELQSLNCLCEVWVLVITQCLLNYPHNEIIKFIYIHCEDFEEQSENEKKNILYTLIEKVQNHKALGNSIEKMNVKSIQDTFERSKRNESKLWKDLVMGEYERELKHIASNYPELEYNQLRLACFAVAYCRHSGH